MKRILFAALIVSIVSACSEPQKPEVAPVSVVPQPRGIHLYDGSFEVGNDVVIAHTNAAKEAELFQSWFRESRGLDLEIVTEPKSERCIYLRNEDSGEGEEYGLISDENTVGIMGFSARGVAHGIQTLKQLFQTDPALGHAIPLVNIEDGPAFRHRGMLLDCCRHFMDKDFVKRYIDLLAYHKMNTLHWHLTEDQGWRIEIKKYPNLTDAGAWRYEEDGTPYGGFYTQEDIREVVQYAAERHITVIPEIELPGHSSAAISSYPWLSCTQEYIPVETEWGVFKDIYCAGNDSTLNFLKDVLTEVMELFPSEYIHIGGDEAPKYRWENCEKCQNRIKMMGLHDEHELQSWFIEDIGKFLEANGRKLIGWDEILEGGLPQGAAVQSWRGFQGGIDAANAGHEVVMSPTSHCYFDYGLESTDLEEVYSFDPIPEGLEEDKKHFVIGGECNMWTERAPQETIDSKVFPRILALSEVLWSYPEERDYDEFYGRVQDHLVRLDGMGVDYGFESVPLAFSVKRDENGLLLSVEEKVKNIEIQYLAEDDDDWQPYTAPISVDDTEFLSFVVSRNGKAYPNVVEYGLADHSGIGKDFTLNHEYSDWYTGGGDTALFDGILGTLDFRDGHWQALQGDNIDCVVDMGTVQKISELSSRFYLYNNAWIFLPTHVEYQVSDDGENWETVADLTHDIPLKEKAQMIQTFSVEVEIETRFVRLIAHNLGVNPDWHDSPGQPSWVFCDEFVVR